MLVKKFWIWKQQNFGKLLLIAGTTKKAKKLSGIFLNKLKNIKDGKEADNAMDVLIKEWQSLKLGDITWPFSQGAFDEFVQRVNSEKENGFVKDEKVKVAAVKYRRIKES